MDYSYIFSRRHPLFTQRSSSWERNKAAYSGGAEYIQKALIQHVSEIDPEFTERLNRAYYFNYPRNTIYSCRRSGAYRGRAGDDRRFFPQ